MAKQGMKRPDMEPRGSGKKAGEVVPELQGKAKKTHQKANPKKGR